MNLSPQQRALLIRHSLSGPRKSVKHCRTCGGRHAGACDLRQTRSGSFARPEILNAVEAK